MTIKAKPFESGAGASVPDASESTKGKIKIASTSESNTGTDDLTAMTPAKVKARIDAALVGGIEYKGIFNVTSATPDLSNATKGDLYVVSGSGTLYGKDFNPGDHLLVNDDMGGVITNSKIDKVDNTDQVSSVNALTGAVVLNGANLDGDHSPSNYSATTDKIEKHLEGIDSEFANRQPLNARLTDVAGLTPSNNHVIVGDSSNFTAAQLASTQLSDSGDLARLASPALTGTPTAPTQSAGDSSTNIATTAYVDSAVTSAGGNQITDIEIKTGSTFTAEANHLYICGYTSGTQTIIFPDASSSTTGDIIGLSTQSATRAVSLVSSDGTTNDLLNNSNQTKGGTNGALSLDIHRQISWFVSDGALWLEANSALSTVATTGAYSDLSGSPSLATVATSGAYSDLSGTPSLATVATSGAYSDLSGSPSLATVATSGAYSDLSGTPTVPSALTDLSDVTIGTAASGEVLRYSGSAWVDAQLAYSDLSGTPSLATVATSGAYSDLSGSPSLATVATSGAYSDLSGTPTVPSALTDLSDVTIGTAASGEYLRYSGSAWVDDSLSVIDDTTPQLGGNLDLNGQDIVTTSNANLELAPDGTGLVSIKGNTTGGVNPGTLKLWCENNSHGISIKSPPHSATASYELVLPTGVGTAGQVLKTDGGDGGTPNSVQLAWVDQSGGGGGYSVSVDTTTIASSSPVNLSAPSDNEETYIISNSGSAVTVNLVAAATCGSGFKYTFKVLGTGVITLDPSGSEYIDHSGQTTYSPAQYDSISMVTDGSNWYLV